MANKIKDKVEQALYDLQTARKMIKKAADDLDSSISSRENRIRFLERETKLDLEWREQIKEEYETKFREIFGVNIDEYLKGYRFERHVVWWLNKHFPQYKLKIWQGDKCYKPYEDSQPISATWNTYPDLIYVNQREKKVIALECKYREAGILKLADKQYKKYKAFGKQIASFMNVDTKVYIMLGCYGTSDRPNEMYCIPLDYFENERQIDVQTLPFCYKVMERAGQMCINKNVPF